MHRDFDAKQVSSIHAVPREAASCVGAGVGAAWLAGNGAIREAGLVKMLPASADVQPVRQGQAVERRRWRVRAGHCIGAGVVASAMVACVSLELPTMAHVHVGHAVTAWPDTPGQKGLLEVALQDAKVAAEHAEFAVAGARDVASVKLHLGHTLHAIDPSLEREGPGSGYGAVKALTGSAEHLAYAQEMRDATRNLMTGLPPVIEALQQQRRDAQAIGMLARDARQSAEPAQVLAYAQEVKQRSGRLAARVDELQRQLDRLLAAENPPYRPVARHYLFGVIRLPSGEWAFSSSSTPQTSGSARY